MNNYARNDATFLADKDATRWSEILCRSSCPSPANIDEFLTGLNPMTAHGTGQVILSNHDPQQAVPRFPPVQRPAIGIQLDDQPAPIASTIVSTLAARYAALAIEKECEIIILTHQNTSGFERFGFRVERIAGGDPEAQASCIAQIRQFWDVEIII